MYSYPGQLFGVCPVLKEERQNMADGYGAETPESSCEKRLEWLHAGCQSPFYQAESSYPADTKPLQDKEGPEEDRSGTDGVRVKPRLGKNDRGASKDFPKPMETRF